MTAFRNIEFCEIPADWDSAQLGREVRSPLQVIRNGLTVEQDREHGKVRVTRIETISDGYISEHKVRFASALRADQRDKYRIRKGDVLFSHINSDPHLGKTAIATKDYADLMHGMNLLLMRANEEIIDPAFLHFVCCYYRIKGVFVKICTRSVNQSSINQARLKAVEIPLPPLSEQYKIACVLGIVQDAINRQRELVAKTNELKGALLRRLYTEGFHSEPQKETEIGPIPASWQVVTLQEVCSFLSGGTPSKKRPDFWQGGIPWVSPKDMKRPRLTDSPDHISEEALHDGSTLAPAGSVFVVVRGMILAKDIPVALAEVPMAFNQDMKAVIPGDTIVPSFLLYAMATFKQNLFRKVGRSAHGTMTLMSSEIADFVIPIPDKATQEAVATAIEIVERKHQHHRDKYAALTDLFRTLLHQLMTGKIRVNAVNIPDLEAGAAG